MSDRRAEVIDLHVHYYTRAYLDAVQQGPDIDAYRRDDGRLVARWNGGVALTVPEPHPGVSERLELMDSLGVDLQVLSVPSPNVYFLDGSGAERLAGAVNEELSGIVRAHPARFRALAMVPMQDPGLAQRTTLHAIDQLGMAGVMLLTNINGVPLDDTRYEPYWEMADSRGLLVYVHPTVPAAGHSMSDHALAIAVGFFADTNLALSRLAYSGVFERYPRIRWVFSHLGGTLPYMLPRLDSYWRQFPAASARSPRPPSEYIKALVFDTASTHRPAIRCFCDTIGADRLVFGSDYPHVPGGAGPYLDVLDEVGATGNDFDDLVGGRASRLLAGEYF